MNHLDLFSGIGGFAYAVDQVWPGARHTFCEIDPFCQKVLAKHWPESEIYGDINEFNGIIELCLSQPNQSVAGVRSIREQATLGGVNNVLPKQPGKDCTVVKKDGISTTKESGKQPEDLGLWSTRLMEENVPVVAKQNSLFSPLTTSMGEEQENENDSWDCSSTVTSKTITSPKNTNSSATTAITENIDLESVHIKYDLLTAGVPCQPASAAGKRRGKADDRWLWPQTFTAIELTRPTWVILENVRGLITLEQGVVFQELLIKLESLGYEAVPLIIPACSVNAPHRRDRVWIVAHKSGKGLEGIDWIQGERCTQTNWNKDWLEVAAELCSLDDGLPIELGEFKLSKAQHRNEQIKAYGNSIVPQVAMEIMKAIKYAN